MYDAVVIGGGPAGLTAGMYLARARYRTLIIEQADFGGQITITSEVVNYPGVPMTDGRKLTAAMRQQAQDFGAELRMGAVTGIDAQGDVKTVHTTRGDVQCFAIVLAMGAAPRKIGFAGEREYAGRGVAYCATCDGEFFTGKDVLVVGGGFAAAEESVFLGRYARAVTVLVREDDFTCDAAVAQHAKDDPKITVRYGTELAGVTAGAKGLTEAMLKDAHTGETSVWKPQDGGTTTIEVGVCPGPYGDMVKEVIAPLLKDDGYELITKEFNDYVQPDKALAAGSIDANLMQHGNYLAKFSADNNLDLVSLGQVPTLGLGVYSNKYDSIDEIADGASIGIANDASNLARSLGVLEQQKLITLDGDVDATKASTDDIASNPKNLTVKPLDAAQLARSLDTVDVVLVPGNYAWAAGLKAQDALAFEQQGDGVINVFAVSGANKDSDFAVKVQQLLVSDEFKDAIAASEFKDFGKPTAWKE